MNTHVETISVTKKQSVYSLTAIQVTGATSLPILNSSIQLYHIYGFNKAFWILLLGNVLVWLVAFAIVKMTANTTKNTLDNVRDYLGSYGAYLVGFILVIATIASFILQTNAATEIILRLIPFNQSHIDRFLQVGVGLGILSTLAGMEGMRGVKLVSVISFPILMFVFLIFLIFLPGSKTPLQPHQFSVGSLAIALGSSLAVAVDYPTFFQHSKSSRNSIIAISTIQGITFLMGIGGLYLGEFINTTDVSGWNVIFQSETFIKVLFFIVVVLSCLCVNIVNVYSASIAWELIVPIFAGRKEYTILGLGLTLAFVLTTNLVPVENLLTITDIALSNLAIVIVIGYLGKLWVGEISYNIEKIVLFFAWLIGSVIIIVGGLPEEKANVKILLLGFALSIILVAGVIFGKKLRTVFINH